MIKKEYIRSVLNIFAKSPFKPLGMHANKAGEAVRKLSESVLAYCEDDMERVEQLNHEIDDIEHEADMIKQTIRSELSSSIMLPVNASDLLSFLKPQDSITDDAQEVSYWLTLRRLEASTDIREGFLKLMEKTLETVEIYERLVDTLSELLETSFSKRDVEETLALVVEVEEMEHQVDIVEKKLIQKVFMEEDALGGAGVYHLVQLITGIGNIADKAEHAADRLRTMVMRR
ncbi:TIGR00153 family protein [Methanolobus halotolerans]|uniref:TIGR00153 family protein n=1 Tax=Methanolobus halotolerans TaxID=2052935 RepID=A0A4E0PY30_9EURY|nr:TIGR00153 family protein [Methanolobus halotolerans]TGC11044.1 TIGR00153 family protein [Methanolobus halotolerans]